MILMAKMASYKIFIMMTKKNIQPCPREWVIQIPNKYIYSGPKAAKAMDVGTLNLEVRTRFF